MTTADRLTPPTPTPSRSEPRAAHRLRFGVVVIGVDGSVAGSAALGWLLEQQVDELHLVQAISPGIELFEAGFQIDTGPAVARVRDELDRTAASIRSDRNGFGIDEVETHVVEDRPSNALLTIARAVGATAIVVGSQGHDRVGSLVGANTGRLVHASDIPVVVVPEGRRSITTGRYVVGSEDVDDIAPLLDFVEQLGDGPVAACTHVVRSIEPVLLATVGVPELTLQIEEASARRLASVLEHFEGTSEVVVEPLLRSLTEASEIADLVVVPSHHDGWLAAYLTGSVAQHLPAVSSCPIAIVPVRAAA
jgi:nucleotide-binding universal stress UspA family protein